MATQHHKVALTERVCSAAMSLASSHIYSHHHYCLHHHPTSAKLGPFVAVPCSYMVMGFGMAGWPETRLESTPLSSCGGGGAVMMPANDIRRLTDDSWNFILIEFTYHLLLACNLSNNNNNNTFYQTRVCIFIL